MDLENEQETPPMTSAEITRMFLKEGKSMHSGYAISTLFFVVIMLVGSFISLINTAASPFLGSLSFILTFFLAVLAASAVKVALQWEKAMVLRLGKLRGLKGPGLFWIVPVIDVSKVIDLRVQTLDIPKQQVITKDNVPVMIDAVLYFKVVDPAAAIINVQDYEYAVSNFAQATLRDVIGGMSLDELLAERQKIGDEIERLVEAESRNLGLEINNIKIQDINMPDDLKRMMSRQASAEREKRATITKAEGDKLAAFNLAEAAKTMAQSTGAMQLRTLQTIDGLGPTASNTVVIAVPIEIMEAVKAYSNSVKKD